MGPPHKARETPLLRKQAICQHKPNLVNSFWLNGLATSEFRKRLEPLTFRQDNIHLLQCVQVRLKLTKNDMRLRGFDKVLFCLAAIWVAVFIWSVRTDYKSYYGTCGPEIFFHPPTPCSFVSYYLDQDNFKVFFFLGVLGLTIIFMLVHRVFGNSQPASPPVESRRQTTRLPR